MLFTNLYSVILGTEDHTTSNETNKASVIPDDLVHQHSFPTTIFLLNSGSFIATLGRNGD